MSATEKVLILTCIYGEEEYRAVSVHRTELSTLAQCLYDVEGWLDGHSIEEIYKINVSQLKQLVADRDLWGFIKEWNSISSSCNFECERAEIESETEIPNIFD